LLDYISGHDIPGRVEGKRLPLAGSITEELIRRKSGMLLQAEDVSEWEKRFPALLSMFQAGVRSLISVPLNSKDQVIGGIHFASLKTKAYTNDHFRVAERISNQIAGAVANAKLFTEQQQAEQDKRELETQLLQAQKMEAIGQLAGGIAHDFNNLLTVIKGNCEISLLELQQDNTVRNNINDIAKAAQRAADLTQQLLAFSRRQIMEMQVVNLNHIIEHVEKMLRRVIREDIELTILLASDEIMVRIDPGQMEQVIMNLCVNAGDAMPRGGKLTIETAPVEANAIQAASILDMTPGSYVILSVTDTGEGMTPVIMEQIFNPFFTTKELGKGTGLGLATVYGIVKQSQGNIFVSSKVGKGTTFKIYLPRIFASSLALGDEEPKEISRGKETILVIEDEEMVRNVTVDFLRKHGYTVLEASNGRRGLGVFMDTNDPIHLVLTDVVMPQMGGPELIKRLRKTGKDFKVLYMSGYAEAWVLHNALLEDGAELINKPFRLDNLAQRVRETLDKK